MAEQTTPRVKQYYDYAQNQVDEQAILDKYNAATQAQFNIQREQNRQAENQFYNQMYNTQKTAMDTIRKSNASAVATGASRGVQAANELAAILGLQQESVASATELAQANRQTAQEETAAVLENVLNAYQQASQERSQLTQQAIEAASLDAQEQQASAQMEANRQQEIKTYADLYTQALANGDAAGAQSAWQRLQELNATNATDASVPASSGTSTETPTNTPTPIYQSGIQPDGSFAISTGDLNNKKYSNIVKALKDYGYEKTKLVNDIFDINNTEEYNKIKQVDIDNKTQSGKASEYLETIKKDAAEGKIPVGATVVLNYGEVGRNNNLLHVYLGNGKFMPMQRNDEVAGRGKYFEDVAYKNLYVPDGYRVSTESLEASADLKRLNNTQYYSVIEIRK